jgi:hypothetical protein
MIGFMHFATVALAITPLIRYFHATKINYQNNGELWGH